MTSIRLRMQDMALCLLVLSSRCRLYPSSCGISLGGLGSTSVLTTSHRSKAAVSLHLDRPYVEAISIEDREQFSCKICGETSGKGLGFIYGCSPCKFAAHLKCVSAALDLVIGDKRHEHPFSLFPRGSSFICDACGIEGSYASYICCTCNIMVHKKCTSLPRIIKSKWHDHHLFHKYFLRIEDFRVLDCIMCNYEVSTDHGSYYCSECDVILHVKCAMKDKDSYEIVENEDEVPNESSIIVIERNNAGEATK
ncbi:uncharacterized protein LOC128039798 [Gossypium raimondii]|uniref:uncharacterized protein LOC128039798 n=1 Tax=Gossypium raimondii TaxID=29730 RepID=UPI00227D7006|nr:uncharacterized protein LOC128039798 [Gossypium raimondii]